MHGLAAVLLLKPAPTIAFQWMQNSSSLSLDDTRSVQLRYILRCVICGQNFRIGLIRCLSGHYGGL